jgi:hypothetical protein
MANEMTNRTTPAERSIQQLFLPFRLFCVYRRNKLRHCHISQLIAANVDIDTGSVKSFRRVTGACGITQKVWRPKIAPNASTSHQLLSAVPGGRSGNRPLG